MSECECKAGKSQHGENEGLQEANEQAEHYPEFGHDPRSQLIQYNQQNFACQDVTK
jgi:hypothetical protein